MIVGVEEENIAFQRLNQVIFSLKHTAIKKQPKNELDLMNIAMEIITRPEHPIDIQDKNTAFVQLRKATLLARPNSFSYMTSISRSDVLTNAIEIISDLEQQKKVEYKDRMGQFMKNSYGNGQLKYTDFVIITGKKYNHALKK